MSYSPEQVEDQAERVGIVSENCTLTRDMLRAYAATLKAAQGRVAEAMYRGAVQAWIDRAELDFPARLLAALKAALSAEPAAQGEAVAWGYIGFREQETFSRHGHAQVISHPIPELGITTPVYLTAPPAQPAERVPEGWRVLQIGAVGSAYDPPNTRRAFTYDWQPGNGAAWALGKASSSAAKASAGDYIDGGLNLLKALQEQGFGVFQIEPSATPAAPAEGGKGVEG